MLFGIIKVKAWMYLRPKEMLFNSLKDKINPRTDLSCIRLRDYNSKMQQANLQPSSPLERRVFSTKVSLRYVSIYIQQFYYV